MVDFLPTKNLSLDHTRPNCFHETFDKDTAKREKRHNVNADSKLNLEVKRKVRSDTPNSEIFEPEVRQKYYDNDEKLLNEHRNRDLTTLPNEGCFVI